MVLLTYFTEIRNHLYICWCGDKKGIALVDLPDDCLSEILSRLPSYDILRCRIVCKRFHRLTCSAGFIAFQTQRAPTIILIHELVNKRNVDTSNKMRYSIVTEHYNNWFFLDKTIINKKLKKLTLDYRMSFTRYTPELLFSFGGLLAFKCRFSSPGSLYIVLNPRSRMSRIIPCPPDVPYNIYWTYICGLFYRPLASEYKLILVHKESQKLRCWYYVYGSATRSWRRINTTPLFFRPILRYDPVVVDMCLYWLVDTDRYDRRPRERRIYCNNAVMIFDINSEKIYTMPHPEVDGHSLCQVTNLFENHEKMMELFEMDKKLWFAHISQQDGTGMNIWELHDHGNWSWVRRYNIRGSRVPKKMLMVDEIKTRVYTRPNFLYINNGILLINWYSAELYILDLAKKTIQKIRDKYINSKHKSLYICSTYTCNILIPPV